MNLKLHWSFMNLIKNKIFSVLVYLERRKSRKLVGELTYNNREKAYVFKYDKKYLNSTLIPLGPELPLSRKGASEARKGEAPLVRVDWKLLISWQTLERAMGFKPTTPTLARLCSRFSCDRQCSLQRGMGPHRISSSLTSLDCRVNAV